MGNSGRSPIQPFEPYPYWKDFEPLLAKIRKDNELLADLKYNYRLGFYHKWMHPQRELNDSVIFDAEFLKDLEKRVEEQRHEMALKCVDLGIFQNVYQAKEQRRVNMI